jgi:hypothetical protein
MENAEEAVKVAEQDMIQKAVDLLCPVMANCDISPEDVIYVENKMREFLNRYSKPNRMMNVEIKFSIGQKVWAMYNNKPQEFTIERVYIEVSLDYETMEPHEPCSKYALRIGDSAGHRVEVREYELERSYYPSKEELINSL